MDIEAYALLNMTCADGKHSRSHGLASSVLRRQAAAVDIPLVQRSAGDGEYEREFKKILREFRETGTTYGVFGDIDLAAHREWIERVCAEVKITPVFPLWLYNRRDMIDEFSGAGFRAVIVSVLEEKIDKKYLGRNYDSEFIEELQSSGDLDLCGENGEFHTFVYNGPIFSKPVRFSTGKVFKKDKYNILDLL